MKWRCSTCGYVHDGEEPPQNCPKCGALLEKFGKVEGNASTLIDRSRLTNALHMHLFSVLQEALDVAEKGIADNLDPGCVKIFTYARDKSHLIRQAIKAELQGHMSKGKWG